MYDIWAVLDKDLPFHAASPDHRRDRQSALSTGETLNLDFDRRLILQFRGSVVTLDVGLLACRELHDPLSLGTIADVVPSDPSPTVFSPSHAPCSWPGQHSIQTMPRNSATRATDGQLTVDKLL